MSLKNTIAGALQAGFGALNDIVSDMTYSQVTQGAYDAATGSNSLTSTNHTISMVRASYDLRDVDNTKIMATDQQFIAESRLFDFKPSTGDTITDGTEVFSIESISQDPAEVTYIFQGRR